MKALLVLLVSALPLVAAAADGCKRLPVDPEFPAGLAGTYEVVGKAPSSGTAYVGALSIAVGTSAFVVSRKVGQQTLSGSAWLQECGMDRIRSLVVRYQTKAAPLAAVCSLDADGDNYYRATCTTRQGAKSGLEAWFQQP